MAEKPLRLRRCFQENSDCPYRLKWHNFCCAGGRTRLRSDRWLISASSLQPHPSRALRGWTRRSRTSSPLPTGSMPGERVEGDQKGRLFRL